MNETEFLTYFSDTIKYYFRGILFNKIKNNSQFNSKNKERLLSYIIDRQTGESDREYIIRLIETSKIEEKFDQVSSEILEKHRLGELIYEKLVELQIKEPGKITGILLEMNIPELTLLTRNKTKFNERVKEAVKVLENSK